MIEQRLACGSSGSRWSSVFELETRRERVLNLLSNDEVASVAISDQTGEGETVITFPCSFPIKAMGKSEDEIEAKLIRILHSHIGDLSQVEIHRRSSRGGKYLSVTATIIATSRSQLDSIYRELSDCNEIVMAL